MPRINRIRVVNIFYDEDRKLLPDLMFETHGQDTIMLLANGGGKSLLIQLALQVILPNEKMGKRSIKQLLRHHRYTGHVVVEWLLDNEGDGNNYLCTGFCFTEDSRKEFNYFNYLFEYENDSNYDISSLPLVDNTLYSDNVITYQQLRDWISDNKDMHIQWFDKIKPYHKELRAFRILPEEWRNIRETNASEGGVASFFKRGKTTSQLIENILIPGIEEMMFHDDLKKKELVNAFSNYRKLLLDIPIIEKNLKDFEVIREHAQQVVDVVHELDVAQIEVANSVLQLARLGETFRVYQEEASQQLLKLEADLEQLNSEEKQLVWKERSYAAFQKELEYREATEDELKVRKEYEVQHSLLEKYSQEHWELIAIDNYNKYKQAEQDIVRYKSDMDNMDKSEPELKQNLNQTKANLQVAWKIKQKDLQTLTDNKKDKINRFTEHMEILKGKVESNRDLESEYGELIAKLNAWIANYETQQNTLLAKGMEEEALHEPEEYLEYYQQDIEQLVGTIQKFTNKITVWEDEREVNSDEIKILNSEKVGIEKDLQQLRDHLKNFTIDQENLTGLLARHEYYVKDLFQAKDRVLLWIREHLEDVKSARLRFELDKADLEQKWLLLKDYQYYIPHQDLLDIKARLERANLFAITGSEWLAEQNLSPAECQTLLKNQPILPYSIVIESTQLKAVKNMVKQMRNLTPDLPLLFLVKNERNLTSSTEVESFISLLENNVYLFQPESVNIYTSTVAFQNFKDQIEIKIKTLEGQIEEIVTRERNFEYVREQIHNFYQKYVVEQIVEWENSKDEKLQSIREINQQIQQKESRSVELKELIKVHRIKIVDLNKKSHQKQSLMGLLKEYLSLFIQTRDKYNERDRLSKERELVKNQIKTWEEEKDGVAEKREQGKIELNELNRQVMQHMNEFTQYTLAQVEVYGDIKSENLIYDELKVEMNSILEQLKFKQSQRDNIETLLRKCQSELNDAKEQIERSEIHWDWVQNHRRTVFKEELVEKELKVKNQRKEEISKKEEWNRYKSNLQAKLAVWKNAIDSVAEQTGLQPFKEFDHYTHPQQYEVIKSTRNEVQSTKKTLEKNLSDIKNWLKENKDALELLAYNVELETISQKVSPLTKEEWTELDITPKNVVYKLDKDLRKKQDGVEKHKIRAKEQFNNYLRQLEKTQNAKVANFIRNVKVIMENNKLYDYDYIETQFIRIFEALDHYQQQYEFNLQEIKKNMAHLTDLCLRRAQTVYDNIVEIPKNSRVILYGQEVQIIKMSWPTQSDDENKQKIFAYLDQVLKDLNKWKQEGKLDDEIDSKMAEMLRTRNLIQVIAPIEDCLVSVFKPRKESLVRLSRNDRSPWDEVSNWSGGEGYSIYITMFMTIINHIRQQTEGRQNVWKVIMADNPFGIASSQHILEVVFNVAKANQIQFICFTAHQDENILYSFPVVYSLQLRSAYGKEIMQAEKMESGFYRMEV